MLLDEHGNEVVENVTTNVEQTETPEVKVEEVTTETVETPTNEEPKKKEYPTFSSIEDYNKHVQSISSKAKGEILKEIGLDKVADIKLAIEQGKTAQTIADELELTKSELNALKIQIKQAEDDKLLSEVGIPKEFSELFLELVAKDTSELTTKEKAIKVKETIAKMVGVTPTVSTPKAPSITEKELSDKQMADLRKL